jgi:hypothetical protein
MKIEENIIEIQEEVKIAQGDQDLILEKGDKIKIIKEARADRAYSKTIEDSIVEALDDLPFSDAIETIWVGINDGLGMGLTYEDLDQAFRVIKKNIERMLR